MIWLTDNLPNVQADHLKLLSLIFLNLLFWHNPDSA
jgi:hypothetical protein